MRQRTPLFRPDQTRIVFSILFYSACYVYFLWLGTGTFSNCGNILAALICGSVAILASLALNDKPAAEQLEPVFTVGEQRGIFLAGLSLPLLMVIASAIPKFDLQYGVQPERSQLGIRLNCCNILKRDLRGEFLQLSQDLTKLLLVDPNSSANARSESPQLDHGALADRLIDQANARHVGSDAIDLLALKSLAPTFIGHEDHLRVSAISFATVDSRGLVKVDVEVEDTCAGSEIKKLSYFIGLRKSNTKPVVVEIVDHSLPQGKTSIKFSSI
ncbi:MAG: hypothetical protein K2X93_29565 [Candidatus Obscuribacterales bacterium]|nr:hypothetical protein [Candidatus Obscuribacterales bacterium]